MNQIDRLMDLHDHAAETRHVAGHWTYSKGAFDAREKLRAALESALAAAPQPIGEVVVTTDEDGNCVLVSRKDEESRILSVIWESKPAAQVKAEHVASIYITPSGEREFDDWKCDLPVGRNILYTTPPPNETAALKAHIAELKTIMDSDRMELERLRAVNASLLESLALRHPSGSLPRGT